MTNTHILGQVLVNEQQLLEEKEKDTNQAANRASMRQRGRWGGGCVRATREATAMRSPYTTDREQLLGPA